MTIGHTSGEFFSPKSNVKEIKVAEDRLNQHAPLRHLGDYSGNLQIYNTNEKLCTQDHELIQGYAEEDKALQ